jgi:hypothetical protein
VSGFACSAAGGGIAACLRRRISVNASVDGLLIMPLNGVVSTAYRVFHRRESPGTPSALSLELSGAASSARGTDDGREWE